MKRNFKIWAVSEGPFSVEELLYDEGYEFDIPEEGKYLVVCKVEEDKKLRDEEFWFTDIQDAYNFKNFVDSRMEAIEIIDEGILSYDDSGKMC
jgi:neutral trehalase